MFGDVVTEQGTKSFERARGKPVLLYEQVGERLREQIREGRLKPGQKIPPVTKLIKELGVNYQTLNSALELLEQDGLISRERHKRPVVAMRSAVKNVFAFVRWCGNSFCEELGEGIRKFFAEAKQEFVLIDAYCQHENFLNVITHPPEGVGGLVLMPFQTPAYYEAVRLALSRGVKIVFVDRILPGIHVGSVSSDHFRMGFIATKHLIETHHRPVYHINIADGPSSCQERYRGWATVMHENAVLDVESYFYPLTVSEEESSVRPELSWVSPYEAAKRLFETREEKVYSIYTANDSIACGVYKAAEEKGLKVGEKVFVVGADDLPICHKLGVPLSSVRQPAEQVGYEAAKLLYQEIMGQVVRPIHRVLPVELKVRASSVGVSIYEMQLALEKRQRANEILGLVGG